ncbi:MAG: N-acetyltransferase family protein [Deltaproteobacteria bacterium]
MDFRIEPMLPSDWDEVRAIYFEGIETRNATFETEVPDWEKWDAGHHPFARLVARGESGILGWAALSPVSARACYAGVAEASIYVARRSWGSGIGRALLEALIRASEERGVWTLQASIFPENAASLALVKRCGFREIGRRERIARLDGIWRDTVLLERRSTSAGPS